MHKYVKQGEHFLCVYFIQLLKPNSYLTYKRLVYNFLNNYEANKNTQYEHTDGRPCSLPTCGWSGGLLPESWALGGQRSHAFSEQLTPIVEWL